MKNQDQEKFVTVSVCGPVEAVAEAIARIFGGAVCCPDDLGETDADGNLLSAVARERHYDYTDENGNVLYRVLRREWKTGKKSFECEVPKLDGRFGHGRIERKVPYNLPKLLQAVKDGKTIAVCNGERAAEAHDAKHGADGFVATTFYGGLHSCDARYAKFFKGANMVYIVDDGIEPTEDWKEATKFVGALKKMGINVKFISEKEAEI